MKEGIHPKYFDAKVVCACGEEHISGSTIQEIRLEVCSKCHPFFTGKQRFVDTAGRVDKFFKKYGETTEAGKKKKKRKLKVLEQDDQLESGLEILDSIAAEAEKTPVAKADS